MANKLPFFTLVEKVQTGKITEQELGRYFLIQQNPSQPFDFIAGINTDRVDMRNVESATAMAKPLMQDASVLLDRKHRFRTTSPASFSRKSPIIAEGDSWFRLPSWIPGVPYTLVDELSKKYSIINLAKPGDTLSNIIAVGEFWPYILPDANGVYRSDTLIFSAGGNDVVGNGQLWRFLRVFDVHHTNPSDAPYYIKDEFYENLAIIVANYESLIRQIAARAPKVLMLGHGYDYVVPQVAGPWLFEPMSRQGLYPDVYPKLCAAILKIMIDAFNRKLGGLQNRYPANFRHVNLRNTLDPKKDWWDELHAKTPGAKKLAAKYARALDALPAAKAMTPPIPVAYSRLLEVA